MSESESPIAKHRRDALSLAMALLCSAVLAVVVGGGAFIWNQLEQTKADNAALASQVRSLGGQPVAEGKPGDQGKTGPAGQTGPQGPVGPQGPPGVAGRNGVTPPCALLLGGCQGAAGKNGTNGQPGPVGPAGADGKEGPPGKDGQPGADSTVPGPTGPTGPTGPAGPTGPQGPDSSAAKCAEMNGELRKLTVTTTDPVTQAQILVCVLP